MTTQQFQYRYYGKDDNMSNLVTDILLEIVEDLLPVGYINYNLGILNVKLQNKYL